MLISVILSSRNRADDLRRTLQSLGTVAIPSGHTCELLLVDNASTDHTQTVLATTKLPNDCSVRRKSSARFRELSITEINICPSPV